MSSSSSVALTVIPRLVRFDETIVEVGQNKWQDGVFDIKLQIQSDRM
jgi:hypothetical protein